MHLYGPDFAVRNSSCSESPFLSGCCNGATALQFTFCSGLVCFTLDLFQNVIDSQKQFPHTG